MGMAAITANAAHSALPVGGGGGGGGGGNGFAMWLPM